MKRLLILLITCWCQSSLAQAQSYTLAPSPFLTSTDLSGAPVNASCVWTYQAGTTNSVATYKDTSGTQNTNPIGTDPSGRFTAYLVVGQNYKFVYENNDCKVSPPTHGTVLWTQDNITAVPSSAASVDITGTAGENILATQCAYLSDGSGGKNAGQWYKCDSANTYSSSLPEVGLVPSAIASGSSGTIRLSGSVSGLSSLIVGGEYFVGTAGAITNSSPANKRHLGHADTTSSLVLTGDPSNAFAAVAPTMTNGQLLIGSTGATPLAAALTMGRGLQSTTGAGSLTVSNGVLDFQTPFTTSGCVTTGTGGCAANTTNEITLYTFALPGGTLSTNRSVHLSLIGDRFNNSGGIDSMIVRVKYASTTFASGTISSINNGANRGSFTVDCELTANGAANAQRSKCWVQVGDSAQNNATGTLANLVSSNTYTMYGVHNAIAVDSTTNQNMVVTVQLGTANASIDARAHTVITEVR